MIPPDIFDILKVGDSLEVVTTNLNIPPYGFHIWIKIERIVFGSPLVFYGNLDTHEHGCVLNGLIRFEPCHAINFKSG